ncbi:MAG: hypothetical protein CMJ74_05880 [Planctomycetaceae bacterium]|nr:hypothetical protein [Planctomycetaceae bacterium]|tara:strand:+ start:2791 stop:5943 length:3153 start_codon:yes stop_codon:yes gene_type:complete
MRTHLIIVLTVLVLSGPSAWVFGGEASTGKTDFNHDIRPLLATACFTCHGPDENKREADLRLDVPEGFAGLTASDVPVLKPHDPAQSELYRRLVSTDPTEQMPPPDALHQLTATEINRIKNWIEEGGIWDEHWAFVSPEQPKLPSIRRHDWVRQPLDQFILARIEAEGLQPSPEADRRTLIRRVTFDLTGFPPTPSEVRDFLADDSPGAYEQLVDRLLDSPRFGERMAVDWLDASRFADTHGYHEDFHRDMWPWRDWVIRAINQNMPFNQFAMEQIAGDLIPDATNQQLVATGFSRNHGVTASGISEEYRVEYVIDRVKTTSAIFLGLTIGCAQCHDHKYDPITQKDFYRFFAYFNTITDKGVENRSGNVDPLIRVEDPMLLAATYEAQERLKAITQKMEQVRQLRASNIDKWLVLLKQDTVDRPEATMQPTLGLVTHFRIDDREGVRVASALGGEAGYVRGRAEWIEDAKRSSLRFDGKTHVDLGDRAAFDRLDAFSFGGWIYPEREGILLARVSPDQSLRGYEVRVGGGKIDARLTHREFEKGLRVTTEEDAPLNAWSHVFVTYDGSSRAAGVKIYLNGEHLKTNIEKDSLRGTIRVPEPLKIGQRGNRQALLGRAADIRVYNRQLTDAEVGQLSGKVDLLARLKEEPLSTESRSLFETHYLKTKDHDYQRLCREQEACKAELRRLGDDNPTVMVMQEMKEPRETFILNRGQYDQHGEKVHPGTPAVLPALPEDAPPNRLGLATWLTDQDHPLFGRVMANRLWQMVFGIGIVETAEDFGIQGARPTHPQLLDYLAREFASSDWNIKRLIRHLVLSATYRQSSVVSPERLAEDRDNRLLARGPRYRMSAEMIRDAALAASGLLVDRVGGPSVKPYQPSGLWIEMQNRPYEPDHGENLYRRSLYTYIKRSVPPPNMVALDATNREVCTMRRQRTSTPLAALVMLNDPTFVEAARALAGSLLKSSSLEIEDCIHQGYLRVVGRSPSAEELDELLRLFARQREIYREDRRAAESLVSVGESPHDSSLPVEVHAALTCVASVILNLDETISKE